jgi:hypothetical protein
LKAEVRSQGESKAEIRAQSVSKALVEIWFQIANVVSQRLTETKKLLGEKEVELRAKDP